jgi:acyl-CoA thioester hydrolase
MDQLGYGLAAMLDSGFGWPVVDLQVKYLRISRYADRLRVRAALVEWESQLTISYLVTDAARGERVARARTRQVAVDTATGLLQFTSPPEFVACIEAALARAGVRVPAPVPGI